MTDTQRTATEQLLVSNAIDQAVSGFDFSELAGKTVFFETQYLDNAVDRGYLVSSLRQALLARGCVLMEDRAKATYVVEARSGGIGTDRHAVLVGIPQMNVPAFVPGQPSQIPEIPFAKKTDQEGTAKIAVFAYNRETGQLVWQSGVVKAMSTSKDTWVLGAGPFQQGTIRNGTEFAGEQLPLPLPHFGDKQSNHTAPGAVALTQEASWPEAASPTTGSKRLAYLLGNVPVESRPGLTDSNRAVLCLLDRSFHPCSIDDPGRWPWNNLAVDDRSLAATAAKDGAAPAAGNAGGQAESEPSKVLTSGVGHPPGTSQVESEPRSIWDSGGDSRPDG
jgi:hypothetical protein